MILIGLAGKKQSGKNEVARMFAEAMPSHRTIELAVANPLKDEVCAALGITRGELDLHKSLYRGILQWWGTEYRRSQNINYWTDKFLATLMEVSKGPKPMLVIVTDVRFESEYYLLKELGAYLFRVTRPMRGDDKHTSETAIDHIRMAMIDNSKDLAHLKEQVNKIVKRLKQ
jgi:hypothetical protein